MKKKMNVWLFALYIVIAFVIVVFLEGASDKTADAEPMMSITVEPIEKEIVVVSVEPIEKEYAIDSPVAELPIEIIEEPQKVWDDIKLTEQEQIVLWNKCEELHLNYWLILALCESESSFRPDAVGDNGKSIGYMQINKCNWQRMLDDYNLDVNEPIDNLLCGAVMFRELLDKYDTATQVIMSYKCGEKRAKELIEQGVVLSCVQTIVDRAIELEHTHTNGAY